MIRLLCVLVALLITTPVYSWTYVLDFEGGTAGKDATPVTLGGFSGVLVNVKFASDRVHSGSRSAKFTFGPSGCPNDRVAFGWLDFPDLSEGSEIWVRWFQWVDTNWAWPSNFVKVMRIATTTAGGSNEGMVGIGDGWGTIYYGNEPIDYRSSDFTSMTKGQWQCFEMYHKISRTTPIARVWRDGVLVFSDTTHSTLRAAGDILTEAQFYGTSNCPGINQTQYIWIDDIKITNEVPVNRDEHGYAMIGPTDFGNGVSAPKNVRIAE